MSVTTTMNPALPAMLTVAQNQGTYSLADKIKSILFLAPHEGGDGNTLKEVTKTNYKDELKSGLGYELAGKLFNASAGNKAKIERCFVYSPALNGTPTVGTGTWIEQTGTATATASGTPVGDYVARFEFTTGGDLGTAEYILYIKAMGDTSYINSGSFTTVASDSSIDISSLGISVTFTSRTGTDIEAVDVFEVETNGAVSLLNDYLAVLNLESFQKALKNVRYCAIHMDGGFDFAFIEEVRSLADEVLEQQLGIRVLFAVPYEQRDSADEFKTVYIQNYKNEMEQFLDLGGTKRVVTSNQYSEDGFPVVLEGIMKKAMLNLVESPAEAQYSITNYITKWDEDPTVLTRLADGDLWADIENEFAFQAGGMPYMMLASEQYGYLRLLNANLLSYRPKSDNVDQRRNIQDAVVLDTVMDYIEYIYYINYYSKPQISTYEDISTMLIDIAAKVSKLDIFTGQIINLTIRAVDDLGINPLAQGISQQDALDARNRIAKTHAESGQINIEADVEAYGHNEPLRGTVTFRKFLEA